MCAAITSTALTVGISGYQMYQGAQDKKKAQAELNDYERQALTNAFENVKISTMGTDLMREESQRNSADLVDASRNAGIRGVLGAIPKIQSNANSVNRQIQVDLDNQVMKREYAIAGDETNLRDMREVRDNGNINALSSQIQKGEADMWNGIGGMAKGIQYGANNIDFGGEDKDGNTGSYAERQAKRVSKANGGNGSGIVSSVPASSSVVKNTEVNALGTSYGGWGNFFNESTFKPLNLIDYNNG